MTSICFFIDRSDVCSRKDPETEKWLSVARTYAVDKMLLIDRTNKSCFQPASDDGHSVEVFKDFDDVVTAYPDSKYVMIERQGPVEPTPLPEYDHPTGDVVYVFGPDGGGIESLSAPDADWVVIPMADGARWGMWAVLAAAVVMGDRWNRGNNR